MRPELAAEVDEWVRKAETDLGAAEALLRGPRRFPAVAAFLCQQAAEKMLKAFLTRKETRFALIHDLRRLCELCAESEPAFATLREAAASLTPYAVAVRYPGRGPDPDDAEAEEALRLAQEVTRLTRERLLLDDGDR